MSEPVLDEQGSRFRDRPPRDAIPNGSTRRLRGKGSKAVEKVSLKTFRHALKRLSTAGFLLMRNYKMP